MSKITLSIKLTPQQGEAYLHWLTSQYELAMAACWYSDKYRYTPIGLRAKRVLEDHPYIAGLNRSARELCRQLKQGAQA
jgi:hypothetical protein